MSSDSIFTGLTSATRSCYETATTTTSGQSVTTCTSTKSSTDDRKMLMSSEVVATTGSYEASTDNLFSLRESDVRTFRFRYLCLPSCNHYCQHRRNRIPSGKAVYLVLLMCLLEEIALFGSLSSILSPILAELTLAEQTLVQAIFVDIISQVLYPIAGWLADVWIGRDRAIHISLWILWVGYSSTALLFLFNSSIAKSFLLVGYLVISIGAAGFKSNVIPFGADQILYRTSEELSSYFYWYYWVRNVGGIVVVGLFSCSNMSNYELHASMFAVLSVASISVTLSLYAVFNDWLFIDRERRNPMKTVANVLYTAAVAKRPQERSAFSFGMDPPPRIDLAKFRHGGRFTNEEVEDVKTFLRLLLVLSAMGGAFVVYTGITTTVTLQIRHMKGSFLHSNVSGSGAVCAVTDDTAWGFNVLTIALVIPILDQVIFPWLRDYTPSMLKKIGIGYFLALLSSFILLLFEGLGHNVKEEISCMFAENEQEALEINAWLTLIPHTVINIAEIFLMVSGLEFLYAQSPHNMRGMMIGLFYFAKGVFALFVAVILFIFSKTEPHLNAAPHVDCGFWYYLILFIVGLISFIVYILVSRWYKNRQRGELEESELFYRQIQQLQ